MGHPKAKIFWAERFQPCLKIYFNTVLIKTTKSKVKQNKNTSYICLHNLPLFTHLAFTVSDEY